MSGDSSTGSYGIGADLGGTKVSAALLGPGGEVVRHEHRVHDGTGPGAVEEAADLLAEFAAMVAGPARFGLSAAGLVDRVTGDLVLSALLSARDVPLGDMLGARLGADVLIENDANATLAGVQATTGPATAVLVALGTGVGGALSVDGRIVHGANGFAAEFGHIPVEIADGRTCPCGGSGCLELVAGGSAVVGRAGAAGLRGTDGGPPTGPDVVHAAARGDATALGILESAGDAVGTVLSGLIATVDPSIVYLSGGFGHAAAAFLLPAIRRRVADRCPFPRARPAPPVVTDPVGPLAAAIGAARLAQHAPVTVRGAGSPRPSRPRFPRKESR